MKATWIVFAIWLLLIGGGLAGAQEEKKQIEEDKPEAAGRAALRVSVQQVRVDVAVRDKNDNLITGLQRQHFEVYEDKVKQEVSFFEPVEAPMTVVLVVEYSKVLPWEGLYEAIMASYTFVDQMRKDDWVAVVAYDIRPEILVDFTQNKGEVYNALRRLNYPAFRESNFYDTIIDTLDRLQELDQKTAIVVLTTGMDTFSKKNLDETLDRVRQGNSVIYSVSLLGNFRARYDQYLGAITRLDLLQGDAVLNAFAKYTGGEAYFPRFTSQFSGIFQNIAMMLRSQYSLGYVSTNTKRDGKYRKIMVKVNADVDGDSKPDKLKVNHREGYLAPKEG